MVAKQNIVSEDEVTEDISKLTLLDRSVIEVLLTHITIQTTFYKSQVENLRNDNEGIWKKFFSGSQLLQKKNN